MSSCLLSKCGVGDKRLTEDHQVLVGPLERDNWEDEARQVYRDSGPGYNGSNDWGRCGRGRCSLVSVEGLRAFCALSAGFPGLQHIEGANGQLVSADGLRALTSKVRNASWSALKAFGHGVHSVPAAGSAAHRRCVMPAGQRLRPSGILCTECRLPGFAAHRSCEMPAGQH